MTVWIRISGDLVRAVCKLNPDQLLVCELPGYERGRETGVVPALIREVAIAEGTREQDVNLFESPVEGAIAALANARPGDCLVFLALTQRDEVLELIRQYVA